MSKSSKQTRIFISYSSKDRDIVEKIHQDLEASGLDTWRDKTRLETDWSKEIADALADSDVLCLMWSEHAAQSKWVKHEWLTARALEKSIYICKLGEFKDYPEPLHNKQVIRFDDVEKGLTELKKKLEDRESFVEKYDYTILPKNSYIPFNPNPQFTGRHTDLLELYLKMIGDLNNIGINQVGTVGMGGIGKTQLAVEFAYRFSFAFDREFWIQAADTGEWLSQFVELARDRLHLLKSEQEKQFTEKQYIFALQEYCKENPQTLIVMDNVVEPGKLNNDVYLFGLTPLSLGCNILFTTRQHFRLKGVSAQSVDILSKEAAFSLLTKEREPDTIEERQAAQSICNAVGYLPLAIVLASGYLNNYDDVSFTDYKDELLENKLGAIDIGEVTPEELATRHVASVGFTLKEDWKRLTDENARQLFLLAGQFSEAEIIPKARLGLLSGIEPGKTKLHRPLDKAFYLLHDLSLVEKLEDNTRAIRLHPLIREFANGLIPSEKQLTFKANAVKKLKTSYFDYVRLKSELEKRGVKAIINDMQCAINWWDNDVQELNELNLLQSVLRLSNDQINQDSKQLVPHLIGRLMKVEVDNLQDLVKQAREETRDPWMCLFSNSLIIPGGPLIQTLEGHKLPVGDVAITFDGRAAVSASWDKTLKVWNLQKGTLRQTLDGHSSCLNTLAITSNGQVAVFASDNHTLKIWDLQNNSLRYTLEGHSDEIQAVAITPDGQAVISASNDTTIKVWNLQRGTLHHTLEGHSDMVKAIAVTPSGQAVVSASFDKTLKVWDWQRGTLLRTLEGHNQPVLTVVISPDGQTVVSSSVDDKLIVWDLQKGTLRYILEGHRDDVKALAITPDGKKAVSGSYDKSLKVWDLNKGTLSHTLYGHTHIVNAIAITPDGQLAVSASSDKTLKVWDLQKGILRQTLEGHSLYIHTVVITPDGHTAVSASMDCTLKVWDLQKSTRRHVLGGHGGTVNAIAVTSDGRTAISASSDHTLKVWDLQKGSLRQTLEGHNNGVIHVTTTPNVQEAVSTCYDNTLKVWDLQKGILRYSRLGHREVDKIMAITPDGQLAVITYRDTLKVWDLKGDTLLYTLDGHRLPTIAVVIITPDGRAVVSTSSDNTLKLWDLQSGTLRHTLEGHSDRINAVAITPDGRAVVSTSSDNTLKLWDLQSGTLRHTLEGHSLGIKTVVITPDGLTAVSASMDCTLKVWDLQSGTLRHTMEGHSLGIETVVITPDGLTAVSASMDCTLKVWDLQSGNKIMQFIGESWMTCCTISFDGKTVVAGDSTGQVHMLRLEGMD